MIRLLTILLVVHMSAGLVSSVYAQAVSAPAEETQADPTSIPTQDITPVTPPPGEEVMRPTEHGIRLTPRMAREIADKFVNGELKEWKLTTDQKSRLSEGISRQTMQLGNKYGKELGSFAEYLYEKLIEGQGRIAPEAGKEFAQRAKSALPAMQEFTEGLDDFRPILKGDQLDRLEKLKKEIQEPTKRFETKMDRWAEGKMAEKEDPFNNLDQEEKPEDQKKPPKPEEMRRAEGTAMWNVQQLGPREWKQFLGRAREYLNFTDEQFAEGEKLLKEYRDQAKPIMTKAWKQQVRQNRIRYYFRWQMQDQPIGPWLYHLDREYNELAKPVKELGRSFRGEVMALATDQQRQAALSELQELAAKHGMTADQVDAETLHLAEKEK